MKITEDDVGKRYRRKDGAIVIITGWKSHGDNGGFVVETNFCMYNTLGDSDEYNADYAFVECLDDAENLLCPCGCQLDRDVAEEFDHGMGYFETHLKNNGLSIEPIASQLDRCPCGCGLQDDVTREVDDKFYELRAHLEKNGYRIDPIMEPPKPKVIQAMKDADEILKTISLSAIAKALPIDEEADARVMEFMGRKAGEETARELLKK